MPFSSPTPNPIPGISSIPSRLQAHTTMLTLAVTSTCAIITPVFLPVFVVATIPITTITSGYPPTHSCIRSTHALATSAMAGGAKCWGNYNRDEAGGAAEVKGLHLQIRSEKVAMETLDKDVREMSVLLSRSNVRQERPSPADSKCKGPGARVGVSGVRRDSRRQGLERSRGAEGLVGCCLDVGFYSQGGEYCRAPSRGAGPTLMVQGPRRLLRRPWESRAKSGSGSDCHALTRRAIGCSPFSLPR